MDDIHDIYENPLITRYARREASELFSARVRTELFRELWIALAESEKEMGLNITDAQISELKAAKDDIDFDAIAAYEKQFRHDVMANIHAYGDKAPNARAIIHLGATSCYVTDNADLIIYDRALDMVIKDVVNVMDSLSKFARKYKSLPTLGYTHLQPAQLTTVGKRATLWLEELLLDYETLTDLKSRLRLRGVKGTTGTQASFLDLFDGDGDKVFELERRVAEKMGYERCFEVTGQTYSRKFDYSILAALSGVAQSAYKFAGDIRLLQNFKEIEEPFEKTQVGSSAMAYKRNPMRSERICSLARYVMSLPTNAAFTASTQWFERTLDDSANRRIVMAQAFLAISGIMNVYLNVCSDMVVYDKVIAARVASELPFMATENIIMEGVKRGGDRQQLHEEIRRLSMEAGRRVKLEGLNNDLISRIEGAGLADADQLGSALDANNYIGLSAQQVDRFLDESITPVLKAHSAILGEKSQVEV